MMRQVKRSSVLALFGVLALTGLGGAARASALDDALKYIPADFTTVVALDVDALRSTALFGTLTGLVKDTGDLKALQQEAGFDWKKDVQTVVFAGPDELQKDDDRAVAVLGGRFDVKRLLSFFEKAGDKPKSKVVAGVTVYAVDRDAAVAFDGKFIVLGAADLVDKAIAAKSGKNVTSGKLGALIKRFAGTKGGFAVFAASKKAKDKLAKEMADLGTVEAGGMSFDAASGLVVKAVATFATPKAAAGVVEGIKGGVKDAASDPEMKELGISAMAQKLTTKADGKNVELGLKLETAEVKKLIELLAE